MERTYADWSGQYENEDDLLGWYESSRSYLSMDPVNEFNLLMQKGFLYRQNFDTVAGTIDASFEAAALTVAGQKLDGAYWSLSEHNDRFWNDLMAHYNITDTDAETLDLMMGETAGNIHPVHMMEWVTLLDSMVYHGYATPEQYVADPGYWADIAMESPLLDIPAGDAAQAGRLTPQAPQYNLVNIITIYNSHDAAYHTNSKTA